MTKRSPYELDGTASLGACAQRTRKKKRREARDCDTEANEVWLTSILKPNVLPVETQHNEVKQKQLLVPEKKVAQTQMSVEDLEQKKMLLPYLDKIEYINCQLRQRGLLPAAETPITSPQISRNSKSTKPPSQTLPDAIISRNQDQETALNPAPVTISNQMLRSRYPRFYEAILPADTLKFVLPRQRGINWLLKMIEVVYNAFTDILFRIESDKTEVLSVNPGLKPTNNPESLPFFTRRFLHQTLGLPQLADQEGLDLIYNTELVREKYPQVALFSSFLREVFDQDKLLFFLFLRRQVQDEFDLEFVSKEKLAHTSSTSGSKKFIALNMIELRTHLLIPDGNKQVFLSKSACESVMQRVFDFARHLRNDTHQFAPPYLLAQYIVQEIIIRVDTAENCFRISTEIFFTILVDFFSQVAEDILAQFKFNDDGESLSNLIRLRDTITFDSKVKKWLTLYTEQERALRNQKIELRKLERNNCNNQFRVQIQLLANAIRLQEQELQHIQKKISDGEKMVNNVWKDVVTVNTPAVFAAKSAKISANLSLMSVLGRFEAHIGRLHRKHDIVVKASTLLALPWQKQMEQLRLRMVIRIQRAYRVRICAKETKKQAREQLVAQIRERESKLKNLQLERKRLEVLREKDVERHQSRVKARQTQEDKHQREHEQKQKKLLRKARQEEATQRAATIKKKELANVLHQWQMFVMCKKKRRQANVLFAKFQFIKWKAHFALQKKVLRAASTIQRSIRKRKIRVQLQKHMNLRAKRNKVATKYLLKVQFRMINRLFHHWAAFTMKQQRMRENFATIVQKRESHWFQRWIKFVNMIIARKFQAVILIQRQYRGRMVRHVFQLQCDRHRKAICIQRVYRGYRAQIVAQKRKKRKNMQQKEVEIILRRVCIRQVRKCFDMLIRFTYWKLRMKKMAEVRRFGTEKLIVFAWKQFVLRKKETRNTLFQLRNCSCLIIQRNFRTYRCQVLFRANVRLNRAAIVLQRVFRGYSGRQAAKRRRWEMNAAVQIQTSWRRYCAKLCATALRTDKILLATYTGDYTTVKRAIARGFGYIVDAQGNNILHIAAAGGHKRLVKLCLRNSFAINLGNCANQTALHLLLANLCAKTQEERVALGEYMIQHGAWHEAPDNEGFTPLLLCASLGQSEAIEMLLNHGVNTDTRTAESGLNALQLAVEGNFPSTLQTLLESGNFDTGENGRITTFLLHTCAGRGFIDCLRVLIAHIQQRLEVFGSNSLNLCDNDGYTPLIYAVSNGFVDITECLLAADAGPDFTDSFGRSALHFALLLRFAATRELLVNLLLEYDADVNLKDRDGDSPLHLSCQTDDRVVCTRFLLTNGAVICANWRGNHPTHIAACTGAIATLKLLLDYGGDINLKNYEGRTPLGMARMSGQRAIVEYVASIFAQKVAEFREMEENIQQIVENVPEINVSQLNFNIKEVSDEANSYPNRTQTEWTTAVSEAYCMGSLAEWTQYVDAATEVPFYYTMESSGDFIYTWESPVEFDAAMGEKWEIVRGFSTYEEQNASCIENRYYLYHNRMTDELTSTIPAIDYALLQHVVQNSKRMKFLRARVSKVSSDELSASAMEYMRFFRGFEQESAQMRKEMRAALKIQRHFRAKRTHLMVKALLRQNHCAKQLQRVFRGRQARRATELRRNQQIQVVKLQAAYRGHLTRRSEGRGLRAERQLHLKRRLAARAIQRIFRGYEGRQLGFRAKIIQRLGPKGYFEWEDLRKRAKVMRTFKVYDEMEAREFPGVKFYSHQVTRSCSWEKPLAWVHEDHEAFEIRRQLALWGYTQKMQQVAQKLQKLWRARIARISLHMILRAIRLMKTCEHDYLADPTHLAKMGNYVLYLHTIVHDYDRARPLYSRLLRIMTQRGPDVSFVLFSYGIFLYIMQEEDNTVVEEMILRAKLADPLLLKYKVAFVGFFRQAILQNPDDAEAHVNYAACVQWLYEQYEEATTHYLFALALAPQRKGTMEMFQYMLDRKRRIECAKLTPRSRKELQKSDQFDAFAQFRKWQAKQAEDEDQVTRMAVIAQQDAVNRAQAAQKIQTRYRQRNAKRKVTKLRLQYKIAAAKAEQVQQQALYDRISVAFENVLANLLNKTQKGEKSDVLCVPIAQLDAIFSSLEMEFKETQRNVIYPVATVIARKTSQYFS